jgi:hypothetical protein
VNRLCRIALASLAVAGCRDDGLMNQRRFVLESIDGIALPAVEHETVSGRYVVLADTIVFVSSTRGFHTRVVRVEPTIAQPVETVRTTTEFTYELTGSAPASSPPAGSVSLTYVCGIGALDDCLQGPHLSGVLHETTLTMHVLHQSPERERRYVRR